jgi:undecaprenyl diphosphate synthase
LDARALPRHVAVVMDGNGRWANQRGLPRVEGHRAGERALVDVVAGAVEAGVEWLSLYAFSTENWKRSPAEVRFLMGFSRQTIREDRDLFDSWGVRIVWSGRRPRLWRSVAKELVVAERQTQHNAGLGLNLCVNYGSRLEIADAVKQVALDVAAGRLDPARVTERTVAARFGALDAGPVAGLARPPRPHIPDVDLFVRTSGEQRLSNFLLWQSAYAELCFVPELWPDVDRRVLWRTLEEFAGRGRRFGGATDTPVAGGAPGREAG